MVSPMKHVALLVLPCEMKSCAHRGNASASSEGTGWVRGCAFEAVEPDSRQPSCPAHRAAASKSVTWASRVQNGRCLRPSTHLAEVDRAQVERIGVRLVDLLAAREGVVVAAGGGGDLPGQEPRGHTASDDKEG